MTTNPISKKENKEREEFFYKYEGRISSIMADELWHWHQEKMGEMILEIINFADSITDLGGDIPSGKLNQKLDQLMMEVEK